jgi:two-component system chemotaxis sensor kinase CheA
MDTESLEAAAAAAIDRAALLPVFVAESEENRAALEEALLALEESPDDEELVATIFRAAHTLKGNSESLGFGAITACAHAVETVLERLRSRSLDGSGDVVSVLLAASDALSAMLADAARGATPKSVGHEDLLRRLAALGASSAAPFTSAAPSSARKRGQATDRTTLRVDLATVDRIVTHLEELAIARARLAVTLDGHEDPEALDALTETDRHFDQLREHVMRLRLVPIGPALRAHARAVRDLAPRHGKLARLVIEGAGVEVDAAVLEALRGPITHMVRNAIDHGLEAPDARRAAGKDPVGTITLRARQESGRLVVEVSDDGAGFRRDRIVARAKALGLVAGDGSSLTDREVYELVFARGFSTAEAVSDLSGRGVGMDVVGHNVGALKGTVDVTSRDGQGSAIAIRVPLTLSIVEGFAVGAGGEAYVIPLESVRECIELPSGLERHEDACGVLSVAGGVLPYVRLRDLFGLGGVLPARENVVVVEHRGLRAGLAVDTLRGRAQAVAKPLAALLQGSDAVSGTTLLGDGRVALILDVPALLRDVMNRKPRVSPLATEAA